MKKYETPVIKVTVIESESIITISGSLSEKASSGAQSSFDKIDINY